MKGPTAFRVLLGACSAVLLGACGDGAVEPSVDAIAPGGATIPAAPAGALSLAPGAPAEIVIGETVTVQGTGFSAIAAENAVTLGAVPATVLQATPTSLTVTVPSSAFTCGAARPASLAVSVAGKSAARNVTVRTARPSALAPGASVILAGAQRCIELSTPGSRYLVSVVNASRAASSVAPFELLGSVAGSTTASAAPLTVGALATSAAADWSGDRGGRPTVAAGRDEDEVVERRARLHHRILETNRGLRARLGKPGSDASQTRISASPGTSTPSLSTAPTSGLRATGDTATLRIADINASNACSKYFTVRTRVAYAGTHAILLEDVTAPLAGSMDATYRAIGEEFDRVMWPVLTANFGNPLAMDARLDRNDRIIMLFSPVVNDNFTGIAGFVIGCDFFPRAQAAASNEGEVFYATVPTSLTGSLGSTSSRDGWLRSMRSTIIHEAKHITAYAERLSRGYDLDDAWVEEGTARHSEELYARALTGGAWQGNAGYSAIACEVRPGTAGCTDRPYVMYKHFNGLAEYLGANGTLSPLGQTSTNDYNYYASAWSLLRWAADLAPSEGAFFQALTRGPASGVANLEAATGRPWDEILADWTMALALDDYAGFTAARAQRVGTWNLRDVFAGMNRDFPTTYARSHPLAAHAATFGGFSVQGTALRGGSGSMVELTGSWAGPQVLELRLPGGGVPSSSLRLAITRVQ